MGVLGRRAFLLGVRGVIALAVMIATQAFAGDSSKAMPTMKFSVMVFYMCDDNNIPVRTTGMGYERYKDELRVTCDRFEVAPGDVRGVCLPPAHCASCCHALPVAER